MKRLILYLFIISLIVSGGILYYSINKRPPIDTKFVQNVRESSVNIPNNEDTNVIDSDSNINDYIDVKIETPGRSKLLNNKFHVYQSFNNCGPATLSMALSWYGINAPQEELAEKMRPYQHPKGDNDDKTIFTYEFVDWAKEYGVEAVGRVNGDIDLIRKFLSNGYPVVVKTWLKSGEDIGHFRLVTGYDDDQQLIYFDDSYDGPNRKMNYYDFLSLWQPFNYSYIVLYHNTSENVISKIIGHDWNEEASYRNSISRAEKESEKDSSNVYPIFNISTASYHIGDYQRSVNEYEKVKSKLPRRMLWYQIEPIKSYFQLEEYDNVFEISDNILENGNRAFSELYFIKGEIYLKQGLRDKAQEQFNLAVKYNDNFENIVKELGESQ
jgi:tetratricopeptide (TPR) repeat protein